MPKFKLEIKDPVSNVLMDAIEFEEKVHEEAKAKSYKLLLDKAEQYADGEYTGTLFRKYILFWKKADAPIISCRVVSGKAKLTVKRFQYKREKGLIMELKALFDELVTEQQKASVGLLGINQTLPYKTIGILSKIKHTLKSLYDDYRPEYIDAYTLSDMEKRIENVISSLQNAYATRGDNAFLSDYPTTFLAEIGEIQVVLFSFIKKNRL